jgi:ascorbate-specific PTS system EIIC-type component UlaA
MANDSSYSRVVEQKIRMGSIGIPLIVGAVAAFHGELHSIWGIAKIVIGVILIVIGAGVALRDIDGRTNNWTDADE